MPGRGPEEILRGHKKILTSEGGGPENILNMKEGGGGSQNIKFME